jgi:ketosteroid isomerase-like protein
MGSTSFLMALGRFGLGPFLIASVLALAACERSDPEGELRVTIAAMAQAVERREPDRLLAALAEDFTRESGEFDKQDARRMLAGAMLRNERIQLATTVTDVHVEGDRAAARLRVIATGGAGLLPERGQTWDISTAWRREAGEWKLFNAEWREGL